jgi:hypothetical protein
LAAVGVGWFFSLASVVLCGLGRALPSDYVDGAVSLLGLARPVDHSEEKKAPLIFLVIRVDTSGEIL